MDEVFVPVVGMAPDDVVLTQWLKAAGDSVGVGDVIAVVETSKAELEIEAGADGRLGRLLFAVDDRLAPGTVIVHVLEHGEADPAGDVDGATSTPQLVTRDAPDEIDTTEAETPIVTAPTLTVDPPGEPLASPVGGASEPRHTISPRQRRVAAETARAPAQPVAPVPEHGSTPAPPPPAGPPAPGDRFRAAISASVTRSWTEIPHFTVTRELRVAALVDAVTQWRTVLPSLTMTDLLLRALALAYLDRERRTDLAVGLAVATDRGVTVPVVRNVLGLGVVELVDARRAAVERARAGKLTADDGVVPAVTLSNLGAVGVDQFTGIIPFGQTSMLTVGRAAPRPIVAEDGTIAAETTMAATLNVDHRSWDGLHAGLLLQRLARLVSVPGPLLAPVIPDHNLAGEKSA